MDQPRTSASPALALAASVFLAAAVPVWGGVHYKASTRIHDGAGRASEVLVEGWVSGDRAKIEFSDVTGSGVPFAKKGGTLLTKNGGKDLYLVDPEEKTYAKWSAEGMLAMAGRLLNGLGPLLKIEIGTPQVEKRLDEDGGEVAGHRTRHVQYRTRYAMQVRVIGISSSSDVTSDEDYWLATRWSDPGLRVWLRAEPPRTGNAELDERVAAEREKIEGIPLKAVTVSTTVQRKGRRQTVTRSTTEVSELKTASIPDSEFDIPAGYSEVPPPVPPEDGKEGEGGLGALFRPRRPEGGN